MLNFIFAILLSKAISEPKTFVLGVVGPEKFASDTSLARQWSGLDGERIYVTIGDGGSLVDFRNGLAMAHTQSKWVVVDGKSKLDRTAAKWVFIDTKAKKAMEVGFEGEDQFATVTDFAVACFPMWPHLFGPSGSYEEYATIADTVGKDPGSKYVPGKSTYLISQSVTNPPVPQGSTKPAEIGRLISLRYKNPFLRDMGQSLVVIRYLETWGFHNLMWTLYEDDPKPDQPVKLFWHVSSFDEASNSSSMPWVQVAPTSDVLTTYDSSKYEKVKFDGKVTFESVSKHPFVSRFLLFGRAKK